MEIITKNKCNKKYLLNKFPGLSFENWLDIITLESTAIESLLIMCPNKNIL